jgi:hypothetical protein
MAHGRFSMSTRSFSAGDDGLLAGSAASPADGNDEGGRSRPSPFSPEINNGESCRSASPKLGHSRRAIPQPETRHRFIFRGKGFEMHYPLHGHYGSYFRADDMVAQRYPAVL